MKLVLQVAPRKFVPIQVNEDWTARVEIPKGMDVPRNFNLPVRFYRVPSGISPFVRRWHAIGRARIPLDQAE